MPYIDGIIFVKWQTGADGKHRAGNPGVLREMYDWAIANNEALPHDPTTYAKCGDLTGQANVHQRILDNLAVFCAKLEVTVATAQHFAADPRIWTLGYWRRDDDGSLLYHNWDTTLTAAERQQAAQYVTNNSNISAAQLAAAFDVTDTRREIAQKLRAFFRG